MVDSQRHIRAVIASRTDFGDDLWSVRIRLDAPFPFTPGQYATLGVERDGRMVERPYSIVSAPAEQELEFFFELVPDGALTPLLHPLQAGAELHVRRRAKGVFTLDPAPARRNHLLVATVTGVAPYVSMVRAALHDRRAGRAPDPPPRLVVVEGASRSWEMGYLAELERAAGELPGMRHVATVSRPWEDSGWRGERGRVEDILRKHMDALEVGPEDTTVYLCGHPGMIANVRGIVERRGFPRTSIHEEQYWTPGKAAPTRG